MSLLHHLRFLPAAFFLLALMMPVGGYAANHIFKIASLAPAGSVWVTQFENFAKEVKTRTDGKVSFRVYPGGVMGDDQAMYRKMRVGQLHGGGFTTSGIASTVPEFRVMSIPFLFNSYDEVDYVCNGLLPKFRKQFQAQGLELIAMTEVGFVYAMSTKPKRSLSDLQNATNWTPAGDPVAATYLTTLGITPVQLTIPDVLSSLQSGLVDTVYNSLYGSIVLQWFTKANNVIDAPYGYAYGCFLLDGKKFAKLDDTQKQIIQEAADKHFATLLAETRKSNEEARQVLLEKGVQFTQLDEASNKTLEMKRDETVERLIPADLPKGIWEQATSLLKEFRAKQQQ